MEPNPFLSILVSPGFASGHRIQWAIDPSFVRDEPYAFFVEISGTLSFSEILDTIEVGNTFFYIDKSNRKQNMQDNLYYRIRLDVGEESFYSQTSAIVGQDYSRRQYLIASEIARKEILRSSKFTGGVYFLLKLRTYGVDAKDDSIDPVTGLALTSTSPNYGTTKLGGYYSPIRMYMSTEDTTAIRKLNPDGSGILENSQMDTRAAGFPLIDTNDVIVDVISDHRYLVKDRQNTPYPGTSINVVQTLKLSLLPPTDAIYSISINE